MNGLLLTAIRSLAFASVPIEVADPCGLRPQERLGCQLPELAKAQRDGSGESERHPGCAGGASTLGVWRRC